MTLILSRGLAEHAIRFQRTRESVRSAHLDQFHSVQVVQSESESSYTSVTLPAGFSLNGYMINGTLQVFDVFGAATSTQARVQVNPVNATEQNRAMRALLLGSSGSIDSTKGLISTCGTVMNGANCTGASPAQCNTLHRYTCSSIAHTCGPCLTGFIGVAGSGNTQCVNLADYVAAGNERRRLTVNDTCTTNSECNALNWESCSNGRCVQQQKQCPNDCSAPQGTCGFYLKSAYPVVSVASCGAADSTCEALCTCATGFAGSGCAMSVADHAAKVALRSSLIQSLVNVTNLDDVNEDSIISWANSLTSLAISGDELSASDAVVVHRIANLTIHHALAMGSKNYVELLGLLTSLDSAASAEESDRRRRLSAGETDVSSSLASMIDTVGLFADLVSNAMGLGQDPTNQINTRFRLNSQINTAVSNAMIDVPGALTDLEFYNNVGPSYVQIQPSSTGQTVSTSMISVDASSFTGADTVLHSNPLQIRLSTVEGLQTILFTMVNIVPNPQFAASFDLERFDYTCPAMSTEVLSYTCPSSGTVVSVQCTGIFGTGSTGCPRPGPQCSLFDSATQSHSVSGCSLVGYTEEYTTCSCDVSKGSEMHRRLTTVSNVLGATGVTNMVTTSTYIATQFAGTFEASKDFTSPQDAQKVLIVILMFACLWAIGLLSLVGLCFKRQKRITKTTVDKRRSHKAGSQTHTTQDIKRYLLAYVEKLIPDVYHATKSKMERAIDETRKHHRYLQLFSARDDQIDANKRILTLTKMLTIQTMLMFLLAVLYDLQGPDDDGTCPNFFDKGSCLTRKSILDSSQSYCRWKLDEQVGYDACIYNPPVFTVKIMMYIIILTSIFTSIFNTPIDRLFDTLEAPTGESVGESRLVKATKVVAAGARRASVAAVGAAKAAVQTAKRMTVFQKITGASATDEETVLANRRIPEDVTFAHTMAYMALPEIAAQAQVSHLRQTVVNNEIRSVAAKRMTQIRGSDKNRAPPGGRKDESTRGAEGTSVAVPVEKKDKSDASVDQFLEEIMQQRLILPADSEETNNFDIQWGIEKNTATSADGKTVSTSLFINGHSLRGMSKDVTGSDDRMHELKEKMEQCSDNQVGLDLLHLFMVDLLGRHTLAAKIFENKFEEDFERTQVVSKYVKWVTLFLIVALNAFFMYYSLLKGISKGIHWQNQYLQGCITQLFIEIFLFESIECIWINYWVPDLVSSEVMEAGVILKESAEKISLAEKGHDGEVANTNYHNHLPGEISRTWRNERAGAENEKKVKNSFEGKKTFGAIFFSCVVALSAGLSIMLQALGSLPYFYQRVIIRFVQPVLLSGLTLLWYFAIKNPIYIGVLAAILIVVCFV
eukprot:gene31902-39415_t